MSNLIPSTRRHHPVALTAQSGRVANGAEFCGPEPRAALRLDWPVGGERPWVLFDFGCATVSGYAVFRVRSFQGTPVLRLSYANRREGCRQEGDFLRGSCNYLGPGVDLPILPANPYRYELFTICREGGYVSPLIQGQQRFVQVWLDTPGVVELEALEIRNHEVHSIGPVTGSFECSDGRLTRLWEVSVWTTQIASLEHHDSWVAIDGQLAARKLEHGPDAGLSRVGVEWTDIDLRFTAEIRRNPGHVSAAGWAFRSPDESNGYRASIDLDGVFRLFLVVHGNRHLLSERRLERPVCDGQRFKIQVSLRGARFETLLDGVLIDTTSDHRFPCGRIGFWHPKECWALFSDVHVGDVAGRVLLSDDFSGALDQWDYCRTRSFVADGAKRDRLVWSGDLDWAARNIYYACPDARFMRESLHMLAANQTPEGFVHAAPYPELKRKPASGDYGHFASDEFSAWFVPVLWDYVLFTGDRNTAESLYPALKRSLGYLLSLRGEDGLIRQRWATSKHAGNLELGDVGRPGYLNILIWDNLAKGARLASYLGENADSAAFAAAASDLASAINLHLWNAAGGFFQRSAEQPVLGHEACCLAMVTGLATPEQAGAMVGQLGYHGHGKFQSLMIRGKLQYGYADSAIHDLFAHGWRQIVEDENLVLATTECMGTAFFAAGWGDESHPDTAIAHLMTGWIVGIQPADVAYRRCLVAPRVPRHLGGARACVPTPRGLLCAGWRRCDAGLSIDLDVPEGVTADVDVPMHGVTSGSILVDGRKTGADMGGRGSHRVRGLTKGAHRIELLVSAGAVAGLAIPGRSEGETDPLVEWAYRARSSVEAGRWGLGRALEQRQDPESRGYSSAASTDPRIDEWIEVDFGRERPMRSVVFVPQGVDRNGDSIGYPVELDIDVQAEHETEYRAAVSQRDIPNPRGVEKEIGLYTVIGVPRVRRVRIRVGRVGVPAMRDPLEYRLQLRAVRFVWED